MPGGTNGAPVLVGAQFVYPRRTLAELRKDIQERLGFSAMLTNPPPGLNALCTNFLRDAHAHLYKRYAMLRSKHWWKITITQSNRFYDIPYEGAYTGELTDVAFNSGAPATVTRAAGSFVTNGFTNGMSVRIHGSALNNKVVKVATVAATTLTLATGETLSSEAVGQKIVISQVPFEWMEPRKIYDAWLKDGDTWSHMEQGIHPGLFNQTTQNIPHWFDIRQYVEIWPEPNQGYEMYLYADKAEGFFEHDSDYPKVDPDAVFNLALGKGKMHYGQRDAQDAYDALRVLIGKYNAGTFGAKRYIPCPSGKPEAPESYPQVDFPRP